MTVLCSPWVSTADLEYFCDVPALATVGDEEDAIQAASEILHMLTGRQYPGVCSETLRPCPSPGYLPRDSNLPFGWYPIRVGGVWLNSGWCGCHQAADCSCACIPQLVLGRDDVQTVDEVTIDGTTLDAAAYRLDHQRWLVRVDGETWPCCQDLTQPDTEEGTWSVTISYGRPVPQMLQNACLLLACELVKAHIGVDCKLPARVQTITRQGVTMALLDPQEFLTAGRTGLYEVDLAIASMNPYGLRRRATVWSPEVKGRARRTPTVGS
jgi:hypothetical protein